MLLLLSVEAAKWLTKKKKINLILCSFWAVWSASLGQTTSCLRLSSLFIGAQKNSLCDSGSAGVNVGLVFFFFLPWNLNWKPFTVFWFLFNKWLIPCCRGWECFERSIFGSWGEGEGSALCCFPAATRLPPAWVKGPYWLILKVTCPILLLHAKTHKFAVAQSLWGEEMECQGAWASSRAAW